MAEGAPTKIKRAPFPTEPEDFNTDDRVSFDQVTQSHKLEDEAGEEWEWLPKPGKWVPVVCSPDLRPALRLALATNAASRLRLGREYLT